MNSDLIRKGEVWLVGAGPGDPDLLTRKAERLIGAADIVFHDALVGQGVIDLIPDQAIRVPVGKRSGRHGSRQDQINMLLLAAAKRGDRVVRLKGGDPSLFGRSMEETSYLMAHSVPVRICPGVTAASAAVASAGSALTVRGISRTVQFVTARTQKDGSIDLDFRALANPHSTLAIYMGRSAAAEIGRQLMRHGLPAGLPVLVAVNVSLPTERILRTRLDLLGVSTSILSGDDPAVLIIGHAVQTDGDSAESIPMRLDDASGRAALQAQITDLAK